MVKFQGAFLRPAIPRNDLSSLSDPSSSNARYEHLPCHSKDFTAKYVDDSVKAVSISLKHCLEEDTHQVRPLTFHRRTGHKLKENHNSLQMHLDRFMEFIKSNEFQVNEKKSSVMMFRRSKLADFHPVMKIHEEGEELELVRESKILGFMLSDSLKWDSHVQYICAKASKRIWILMRLMEMGLDADIIIDVYFKEIRSILEYGSVIYHSGLTRKLSRMVESIQRKVLKCLCKYLNLDLTYEESYVLFSAENLEARRLNSCETFINRSMKNPRFSYLFKKSRSTHNVRPKTHRIYENTARTTLYFNSPLLFLKRLANKIS